MQVIIKAQDNVVWTEVKSIATGTENTIIINLLSVKGHGWAGRSVATYSTEARSQEVYDFICRTIQSAAKQQYSVIFIELPEN